LLATGEEGVFGFVIDAHNVGRHRELITEARRRDLDVILDSKILQMGFPGAVTERLSALPWGLEKTVAHLVESGDVASVAIAPSRRQARKGS
jgi:hypothetical protein